MDVPKTPGFSEFTQMVIASNAMQRAMSHLQKQSGFEVNILLYLLWLAKAQYGRLTKPQMRELLALISPWHERVVSELKYTHALVAGEDSALGQDIEKAIAAEIARALEIEQQMLSESQIKTRQVRRTAKQQLADACASIKQYSELKNDVLLVEDQLALIVLCHYVFPELEKEDIKHQVGRIFNPNGVAVSKTAQLLL